MEMKFDRNKKYGVFLCGHDPIVSVMLVVTSPGGRTDRARASSGTLRCCKKCMDAIVAGKLPKKLTDGLSNALCRTLPKVWI